jgi:hypothetical protein
MIFDGRAPHQGILHRFHADSMNSAIVTVADSVLLDTIPSDLQLNNTNWLEYNAAAAHPEANITVDVASDLIPYDDITLVPYDKMPLLPSPDYEIEVTVNMEVMGNGDGYALLKYVQRSFSFGTFPESNLKNTRGFQYFHPRDILI